MSFISLPLDIKAAILFEADYLPSSRVCKEWHELFQSKIPNLLEQKTHDITLRAEIQENRSGFLTFIKEIALEIKSNEDDKKPFLIKRLFQCLFFFQRKVASPKANFSFKAYIEAYKTHKMICDHIAIFKTLATHIEKGLSYKLAPIEFPPCLNQETLNLIKNWIEKSLDKGSHLNFFTLSLNDKKLSYFPEKLLSDRKPDNFSNYLHFLDLGRNQFYSFPEEILEFQSLKTLYVQQNFLSTIPENITKLNSLNRIKLNNNRFSKFPEALCNLSSLTELHLDHNKIDSIPENISKLNSLRIIYLNSNNFSKFPEELCNIPSLVELRLGSNKISSISKAIQKLSKLEIFIIDHNELIEIPQEINRLSHLEFLNMSDNHLKCLPDTIISLQKLFVIYLYNNNFSNISESISDFLTSKGALIF